MATDLDRRITPARPDLAASYLRGKLDAARYVEGEGRAVAVGRAGLHARPDSASEQVSEVLAGDIFTVYEQARGLAWGQCRSDGYVGYVRADALGPVIAPDARVCVPMTPLYSAPDLKSAITDFLPLNARVQNAGQDGDYVRLTGTGGYVFYRHLAPLGRLESDFVLVAQRFVGVPYVWGGKTFAGMDCSGLVQTALAATGVPAPRDTDMMERELGHAIALSDAARGDLLFWKGHMGVVLEGARLLHANGFHMQVAIEPLAEALPRIAETAGPVTAVKRI